MRKEYSPFSEYPDDYLLTSKEVASILGVSVGTLAVWRSTGRHQLKFTKVGNKVRYFAKEIREFLSRRTRSCTS